MSKASLHTGWAKHLRAQYKKIDFNDLVSCTSLGGINIRMLGFVIQVSIYTF
jgi:hypothetical protein